MYMPNAYVPAVKSPYNSIHVRIVTEDIREIETSSETVSVLVEVVVNV